MDTNGDGYLDGADSGIPAEHLDFIMANCDDHDVSAENTENAAGVDLCELKKCV